MAEDLVSRAETVQRRPEYIERLEKALLSGIFGTEAQEDILDDEGNILYKKGDLYGGILQDPDLFRVAPYQIAGQIGRDPVTGAIVGLGPETFATQALMEDADNDGRPDFLDRYSEYFDTAGSATKSAVDAMKSGIAQVQEGRGMYRPSDYVSDFMSPYTTGVIEEVEKDIERQGNVARQRAAAQSVGRGAFGGSRQGVQAAEVERNILDAKSKAAADLRNKNYAQALAASQQAYQQGKARDLEAGRLTGGLGQSYGTLAGTSADIGRVYSALQPADLAFMTGVGEAERAYRQQMIDTARQEYQRPTEQRLLPFQFGYGALTGTPSAGIYSQTQAGYAPPANPFLSGLGAYTTLQGINQA